MSYRFKRVLVVKAMGIMFLLLIYASQHFFTSGFQGGCDTPIRFRGHKQSMQTVAVKWLVERQRTHPRFLLSMLASGGDNESSHPTNCGSMKRKRDSECEDESPQILAVEERLPPSARNTLSTYLKEAGIAKRKLGESNKVGAEADCSRDDLLFAEQRNTDKDMKLTDMLKLLLDSEVIMPDKTTMKHMIFLSTKAKSRKDIEGEQNFLRNAIQGLSLNDNPKPKDW
ncbi:hypothetical protein Tco_0705168 [Tanacetum coccineum]|uniref:Uncharacterized protein n=1 Tax=Tanacetum coccineum TaxID=301880 RepID=A0ABQ4Y5V8_9ASTR